MPALSGNASTYRAGQHRFTGHLAVLQPVEVLRGTVSATPTFPALTVSYTNISGSHTNVLEDMYVRFFDSTGVFKGATRVAVGTITSGSLPIGETSQGVINIVSGDTFRVYDDARVFDKLVSASKTLLKDSRLAIGTNVTAPPPVANAGGLWAGDVDAGQSYATVSFEGSRSFRTDADAGTLSYAWDEQDGTITVGTDTSADITVQFPQGFRMVELVVTDSNGTATRKEIPVWVFDENNRPYDVTASGRRWSRQNGWWESMDFTMYGTNLGMDAILDGALVVYWETEHYGSTQASYGSNLTGRSHIKFVGYIRQDTIRLTPDEESLTFTVDSPMAILAKTPALPQLMVRRPNNGKWRFVEGLTINRGLWYLLHWHASYTRFFDWQWGAGNATLNTTRLAQSQQTIVEQMRDLAAAVDHLVVSDALGRILVTQREQSIPTASRSGRTTAYALTTADILEATITRKHGGELKTVVYGGITDGTTKAQQKPLFSKTPGNAPAHFGVGTQEVSNLIIDSQSDLNTRAGLAFAEANSLYNGAFVPKGAELVLPSGYDIFEPANLEWVTFELDASTNRRGYSSDASRRWVIDSVNVEYLGSGAKRVTLTIDHETAGPVGVQQVRKQPSQSGIPSVPPINIAFPPMPPAPTDFGTQQPQTTLAELALFPRFGTAGYLTSNFYTADVSGGPTYAQPSLSPLSGGIHSVTADAFSPLYLRTGTAVHAWAATASGIYYITDLFGSRSITLQHTFAVSASATQDQRRTIMASRAAPGWVICVSYIEASGGTIATYTTDNGANWTTVTINANYRDTNGFPLNVRCPTLWLSQRTAGLAYAGAFTATASGLSATAALYRTTDYGATWSLISGMTNTGITGMCFHIPVADPAERYLYWTKARAASGADAFELMRTDLTDGTQISVNPLVGTGSYVGANNSNWGMDSSPLNPQMLAVAGARPSGSSYSMGLYTSQDGGLTWANPVPTTGSNRPFYPRFSGNKVGGLFVFGDDDFTATYTDNIWGLPVIFDSHRDSINPGLMTGIIAGRSQT